MEPDKSNTRANSTATVTVACKMPAGMILRNYRFEDRNEPLMGGGYHTVKVAVALDEEYRINGNAVAQNKAPHCDIIGGLDGYALTYGVPKDFWERWLEANKTAPFVKNHLIFAHTIGNSTTDMAKERKGLRSGLERLDPSKQIIKGVTTDVEAMKARTEKA